MLKHEEKTIGYVAFHTSQQILCENGACIVAGSQSAMNRYLQSSSSGPAGFQKRKTLYFQIVEGLEMGGSYAFDSESYKLFAPLARKLGLKLVEKNSPPVIESQSFTFVCLEKL